MHFIHSCTGTFWNVFGFPVVCTYSGKMFYYFLYFSMHRYYSGDVLAPVLTIFIGGNHEASNYLQELPYGGWVAKNIYYMGTSLYLVLHSHYLACYQFCCSTHDLLTDCW